MNYFLTALMFLFSCGISPAQQAPQSIDQIPLHPGFRQLPDGQPLLFDPYREELAGSFLNPDKAGIYGTYALQTTNSKAFKPLREQEDHEREAYDFYLKQLNSLPAGPDKAEHRKHEPDITRLKPGETTPILFYPSPFGGGVFKWFVMDNNIKELWVIIGTPLLLVERIFVKDLPVIVPDESEMGYPVYPGAEFQPLESVWTKAPEGGSRTMIFHTTDKPEQVKAFFEDKLSRKAKVSGSGNTFSFSDYDPRFETYQFSSLSIHQEMKMGSDTKYTAIAYYYPYPSSH